MVAGSFTRVRVFSVNIDRIWKAGVLDGHNLIPKLVPDLLTKIEVLEGDGEVGTIKKLHFTEAVKEFKFKANKIEAIDNENHIIKFNMIEGGLIGSRLKSCSFELKFLVGTVDTTVEIFMVEYDTLDDTPLTAEEKEQLLNRMWIMGHAVGEYLLANPTAYA